jgi:hypothetical protein
MGKDAGGWGPRQTGYVYPQRGVSGEDIFLSLRVTQAAYTGLPVDSSPAPLFASFEAHCRQPADRSALRNHPRDRAGDDTAPVGGVRVINRLPDFSLSQSMLVYRLDASCGHP